MVCTVFSSFIYSLIPVNIKRNSCFLPNACVISSVSHNILENVNGRFGRYHSETTVAWSVVLAKEFQESPNEINIVLELTWPPAQLFLLL